MKKVLLTTALALFGMSGFSQIGSVPIYAPNVIVQPTNQTTTSVVESYISGWLDIVIKDENYYKRQDNIAQADYNSNASVIQKACDYYEKGDYQSAIYYARDIRYTEYYDINNLKHFLLATSYFYIGDVNNSKKWYSVSQKKVDPETMRKIDTAIHKTGMDQKIQQKDQEKINAHKQRVHNAHKTALIIGICGTVTSWIALFFAVR